MAGLRTPHHGRDHRPGGEDPIPNLVVLGNLPWFLASDSTANGLVTLAAAATKRAKWSNSTGTHQTNDGNGDYFSTAWGSDNTTAVTVGQTGFYMWIAQIVFAETSYLGGSTDPSFASVGFEQRSTALGGSLIKQGSGQSYQSKTFLTAGLVGDITQSSGENSLATTTAFAGGLVTAGDYFKVSFQIDASVSALAWGFLIVRVGMSPGHGDLPLP